MKGIIPTIETNLLNTRSAKLGEISRGC